MQNISYEGKVLWTMVDANKHLRHSAYADFGAQARIEVLEKLGFTSETMKELHIGPILFREELIFKREVLPNDMIKVTCELSKGRSDGSRWSFEHKLYRGDGILAAIMHVDGAWIDLRTRKLTALPAEWAKKFMEMPKTENYLEEVNQNK